MQLACSWRLPAGRDAVIEAAFYGTGGGAALRNVDGSFYDFGAERFEGTRRGGSRSRRTRGAAAPRSTGRGGSRRARASTPAERLVTWPRCLDGI